MRLIYIIPFPSIYHSQFHSFSERLHFCHLSSENTELLYCRKEDNCNMQTVGFEPKIFNIVDIHIYIYVLHNAMMYI